MLFEGHARRLHRRLAVYLSGSMSPSPYLMQRETMDLREGRPMRAATATLVALILLLTALVQSVAAAPRPDPRIIGGEPADFGEYPFMVALLFEPIEGTDFQKQYCGGS